MHETVTISREEYKQLQKDSGFLGALFDAGVFDWDGYELAQEIFEEAQIMEFANPDDWEEYAYGMETVVKEYVFDTDRWHQYLEKVVKDKQGTFWELSWKEGATENQDVYFEDGQHLAIEVEPYEMTVTKYRAIKLENN